MADPVTRFAPDRMTYIKSHTWLAVAAMAGGMLVLWLLGNPHVWTGAPAGLAAITVRGWYLASQEMSAEWQLKPKSLAGPSGRSISLKDVTAINILGSFVQIVTRSGDKHLIKYQVDPAATKAAIEKAIA
ncbi:MAG: hypothetical protein AAF408_14325 [Pseudomonadota bacterium]